MTKVIYNEKEIELCDNLEEGELEFALINTMKDSLEDTLELNINDIEENLGSEFYE